MPTIKELDLRPGESFFRDLPGGTSVLGKYRGPNQKGEPIAKAIATNLQGSLLDELYPNFEMVIDPNDPGLRRPAPGEAEVFQATRQSFAPSTNPQTSDPFEPRY